MRDFDEVYRAHAPAVFRYAMRCVSDRALAEDLTAEAFLELYRHRDRIDESRLPAWLITIVKNRARDHWRRQLVEQRYLNDLKEAVPPGPQVGPMGFERWLTESAELKPIHRVCLMLRYGHGMSRTEIASTIGLTETQVKGHLQYGLTLMRKALVKEEAL